MKAENSELIEQLLRLSASDVERLIVDILHHMGSYTTIQFGSSLGAEADIDILASIGGQRTSIAFQIKKVAVASTDLIASEVMRQNILKKQYPSLDFVLVLIGSLTRAAQRYASEAKLSVWDAQHIVTIMGISLREKWFGIASMSDEAETSYTAPSKGESFQNILASILPGTAQAIQYQKWVADVFEYLFVPPLGPIHYEDSDEEGRNRRDIILENWASDGFWAQLRLAYKADQIVVDAKNYAGELKKRPIIDIAHYLKPYGCGMFGIICSRKACDVSAKHAIREQWIGSQKMIINLTDEDMIEMLNLKDAGAPPEEIIRRKIAVFRKSL